MTDTLRRLTDAGVAIWLDDLSRERLVSGNLETLIRDRHVVGVTSNPTIFQKSISGSDLYDEQVHDLAIRGVSVDEAVRMVTTRDIRWACDLLRPTYDATGGVDGRVSLEVDPRLALTTDATVAEARQLWWLVDRPNLFIKIPATRAGLPAITQCLGEGISINVTLIFSLRRYEEVMDAFLAGMERALSSGADLSRIGSVASFFVSRVDTEVDRRLDKIGGDRAARLRGRAAIANARLAYQLHEDVLASPRWRALTEAGARPQRPLWASTGVKDPAYDDTRYVIDLVAPGVVNTMPEPTIEAVADHGRLRGDAVRPHYDEARATLDELATLGVDYDAVVQTLEDQGVARFADSWQDLIDATASELRRLGDADPAPGTERPAGGGAAG
ncbi:MAG: transaldolase [Carbonactinosporaceae bacterium]